MLVHSLLQSIERRRVKYPIHSPSILLSAPSKFVFSITFIPDTSSVIFFINFEMTPVQTGRFTPEHKLYIHDIRKFSLCYGTLNLLTIIRQYNFLVDSGILAVIVKPKSKVIDTE